jgi:PBP1b-binding outer membrane lipoprotein LpoB
MMALRYVSLVFIALLLVGCASMNPKPIEVDVPAAQKHFIVTRPSDPARL